MPPPIGGSAWGGTWAGTLKLSKLQIKNPWGEYIKSPTKQSTSSTH